MRVVHIGKYDRRITFLRLVDANDEFGQKSKKLATLVTVWGNLYPLRGSEFHEIQKIQGNATHKCYVRYSSAVKDISSGDLLSCGGSDYTIESVANLDMDDKILEIYCTRHTGKEAYDHV